MTTYNGFYVLEKRSSDDEAPKATFKRVVIDFDPQVGKRLYGSRQAAPKPVRTFTWICVTRAQIVELKDFYAARRGSVVPFWIPSWRRDFILTAPIQASDTTFSIDYIDYAETGFLHKSRRHIVFCLPSGLIYRKIVNAQITGETEVITLDSAPGVAIPLGTMVSQMLLCRLNTDELELTYITESKATCTFEYIEIPEEAP